MTKYSPDAKPERVLPLNEKIHRIVHGLAKPSRAAVLSEPDVSVSRTETLLVSEEAVTDAIRAWRMRSDYLPPELFSDPAWGMLLELLQAEIQGRRVSLSRLCNVSDLSTTSCIRWLKALESRDLIVRRAHEPGGEFVELAPNASTALRRYFLDVATAQTF